MPGMPFPPPQIILIDCRWSKHCWCFTQIPVTISVHLAPNFCVLLFLVAYTCDSEADPPPPGATLPLGSKATVSGSQHTLSTPAIMTPMTTYCESMKAQSLCLDDRDRLRCNFILRTSP